MTDEKPVIIVNIDSASSSSQYSEEEKEGTSSGQESPPPSSEPVYVNAKQYWRILKRRAAREKLAAQWRIPRFRQKILHESRSRHARNRPRDDKGKFLGIKITRAEGF